MRLAAGHRLGAYETLSLLGAGGMGEVYRARDLRLGRDVAIKILPADRLADQDRRRRFVREAQAASALNHPHIVTIHEIGSADGMDFIVMEYVAGQTLEALLRPGIPLGKALVVAIAIADGLAKAHEVGIVHRDLKPSNVIVGDGDVVKILDFGLAKLVAPAEPRPQDDAETAEPTCSGMIVGTPAYMSPEQASAGMVDSRSDIFAFGALLYEMVTRRRAFAGRSAAETLAAVLSAEPPSASALITDLPVGLEKLIARCLRKEPAKRFQHMADVKVELEEIQQGWRSTGRAERNHRRSRHARLVGGAIVSLLASVLVWHFGGSAEAPPRLRQLTTYRGSELHPALSPDGEQVAFSWVGEPGPDDLKRPSRHIWLKLVGGSELRQLTGGPGDDRFPSWSPDGAQIAFLRTTPPPARPRTTTIHLVSPLGGVERRLGDFLAAVSPIAWTFDGRRIAAAGAGVARQDAPSAGAIHLVPLDGSPPLAITHPPGGTFHVNPAFSPDRRRMVYLARQDTSGGPPTYIEVVDLDGDFRPTAAPRRLTPQPLEATTVSWAPDGQSVVFAVGHGASTSYLARVGIRGTDRPERIELIGAGAAFPFVSPQSRRLVFVRWHNEEDIYAFEPGGPPRPVIVSSLDDREPSYSPDGRQIAFGSSRSGDNREIWLADVDGSNPVQLTRGPGRWLGGPSWSPDGRRIVFDSQGEDLIRDMWVIDVGGAPPRRLTHGPMSQGMGCWSPDGRWIYYRRYHPGGADIWRIPSEGGVPERMTHAGQASKPRISSDGKTLYYKESDGEARLWALPLEGGPARVVVDCVNQRNLDTGPAGLYYVGCSSEQRGLPLYRLDPVTRRSQLLGRIEVEIDILGIAAPRLGGSVLFTRWSSEADLVLVDNFH